MAYIGGNFVEGSGPQMPNIGMEGNMVVGGEAISIGDNYVMGGGGGVQVAEFPGHGGVSIGDNYVHGGGVAFAPGHGGVSIADNYDHGVNVAGNEGISVGDNFVHGGGGVLIADNNNFGGQPAAMFRSGAEPEGEEPAEEEAE